MTRMRYKNFVFPYNPRKIQVDHGNRTVEHHCMDGRTVVEALGRKQRRVEAVGELAGPQAWRHLEELVRLAEEETAGSLVLPGMSPFSAYLIGLDFLGEGDGQVLGYRLRFQEAGEEGKDLG